MDVAPARRLRRAARGEAWKAELGTFADRRQTDIDHLDRLVGRMVRVAMLVKRVECGADAGTISRFELRLAHRHLQRELLPDVTQVEMDQTLRIRGVAQARGAFSHHLVMDLQ